MSAEAKQQASPAHFVADQGARRASGYRADEERRPCVGGDSGAAALAVKEEHASQGEEARQRASSAGGNCSPSSAAAAAAVASAATTASKQRRSRTSFTSDQIQILEESFQRGFYSDTEVRERIHRETGLSHSRIQVS